MQSASIRDVAKMIEPGLSSHIDTLGNQIVERARDKLNQGPLNQDDWQHKKQEHEQRICGR